MTASQAFNFQDIDAVEIWDASDETNRYVEDQDQRKVTQSGSVMRVTVHHQDPTYEPDPFQLVFTWSELGDLLVKGEFFENESAYKKAIPIEASPNSRKFNVYEENDNTPWIFLIDYPENPSTDECVQEFKKDSPIMAKVFKDSFKELTSALASKDTSCIDDDGTARIYVKFLNGRTVQIEHFNALSDDDISEIFYIHETNHVALKKHWTSVSSSIIFSVAFRFSFHDKNGNDIDLILRRSPDNQHPADDFCAEILTGIQTELEEMLNDEIKVTIEDGFDRLEKLILSNNKTTVSDVKLKKQLQK